MEEEKQTKNFNGDEKIGYNITSLVLGILALILMCFPILSIPCAVISIVFGVLGINKDGKGMGIAGLICSGLSFITAIIVLIYTVIVANNATTEVSNKMKEMQNNSSSSLNIFDDNFSEDLYNKAQNKVNEYNNYEDEKQINKIEDRLEALINALQ